jgi:hypothetical protein
MADITTYRTALKDRPFVHDGSSWTYYKKFTLAAGNQNDTINLVDIPRNHIVRNATLNVSATLGTSVTLTLRRDTTALTGATTAASASRVAQSVTDAPSTSSTEGVLSLLIGGAAVGASAVVTVEADFAPVPTSGSF